MYWFRFRIRFRFRYYSFFFEDMNDTESEEDFNRNKIFIYSDSGSIIQFDFSFFLFFKNMIFDRQLIGGGLLIIEVVEYDDVVLFVVIFNSLYEYDGYVKKEQDGCTVDEFIENFALMKNGEGKESKVELLVESSRRLCLCFCVLL